MTAGTSRLWHIVTRATQPASVFVALEFVERVHRASAVSAATVFRLLMSRGGGDFQSGLDSATCDIPEVVRP